MGFDKWLDNLISSLKQNFSHWVSWTRKNRCRWTWTLIFLFVDLQKIKLGITYRAKIRHGSGFKHDRHLQLQINEPRFRLEVELFEWCGWLHKTVIWPFDLSDLFRQSQAQFTVSDLQSKLLQTVSAWVSKKVLVLRFLVSLAQAGYFRTGTVGNLSWNTGLFLCLVFRIFFDTLEFTFPYRSLLYRLK